MKHAVDTADLEHRGAITSIDLKNPRTCEPGMIDGAYAVNFPLHARRHAVQLVVDALAVPTVVCSATTCGRYGTLDP